MQPLSEAQSDLEATLLLYVHGELPGAELASLEQSLAADPSLRQRAQAMRDLVSMTDQALASADDVLPRQAMVERATARAASAVRQWQLGIAPVTQPRTPALTWRRFRWQMPAAVAAAAAIIIGGFLAIQRYEKHNQNEFADKNDPASPGPSDSAPDPLQIQAAITLGLNVDHDGSQGMLMPLNEAVAALPDQPFFDVPLVPPELDATP